MLVNSIALKTYYNWEEQIVKAATQKYTLPAPAQTGLLIQVNPDTMPSGEMGEIETGIIIRHRESVITLPAGSNVEDVADLVKTLNRHA